MQITSRAVWEALEAAFVPQALLSRSQCAFYALMSEMTPHARCSTFAFTIFAGQLLLLASAPNRFVYSCRNSYLTSTALISSKVLYDADALNALGGSLSLTLFRHFLPGSQKLSDAASDCQVGRKETRKLLQSPIGSCWAVFFHVFVSYICRGRFVIVSWMWATRHRRFCTLPSKVYPTEGREAWLMHKWWFTFTRHTVTMRCIRLNHVQSKSSARLWYDW